MSEVNREETLELVIRRAMPAVGREVVGKPSSMKKLRSRSAPEWLNQTGANTWAEVERAETERAVEVVDWLCENDDSGVCVLWREMRRATETSSNAWEEASREGTASEGTVEIDEPEPKGMGERQVTMHEDPETGEVRQGAPGNPARDFEGDPETKAENPEPEKPEPEKPVTSDGDRRQNRRKRPKPKESKE